MTSKCTHIRTLHDIGGQEGGGVERTWEACREQVFLDLQVKLVPGQFLVQFNRIHHVELHFEVDVYCVSTCRHIGAIYVTLITERNLLIRDK